MAEDRLVTIPESWLADIADKIREKRDIVDSIPVPDMPMQIGLIDGGGGDIPFEYGGMNAELIDDYTETWTLDDTTFEKGASSYPTSATIIKPNTSYKFKGTDYPYGDNDIVVVQTLITDVTHDETAENKNKLLKVVTKNVTYISKRSNYQLIRNPVVRASGTINTTNVVKAYNNAGTLSYSTTQYGMYTTAGTPSVANTSSESTYARCNSPTTNIRVYNNVESAENMGKITDATFYWNIKVYKVDPRSTLQARLVDDVEKIAIG